MAPNPWTILDHYFSADPYFMSKHHLDSYNHFVDFKIPMIIQSLNPFVVLKMLPDGKPLRIEIFVGGEQGTQWQLERPMHPDAPNRPLFPNEARIHDLSYLSILRADILIRYHIDTDAPIDKTFPNQLIGKIPVMVHSHLCVLQKQSPAVLRDLGEDPLDQGGYFIIGGKEKVIVAQERNAGNVIFVTRSKNPDFTYEGFIHCISSESVFPKTTKLYAYSSTYHKGLRRNAIVVTVPHINTLIPLFVLFRALGITSDKDILEYICYKPDADPEVLQYLEASIVDGNIVYTQDQALAYLAYHVDYKSKEAVQYILMNNLFPNIEKSPKSRAFFLGHIVQKLIRTALGRAPETDRDNFMYKRVKLSGILMADIFRDFYNAFRNYCRGRIDKEYETGPWKSIQRVDQMIHPQNIRTFFTTQYLTDGLVKSLRGRWGVDGTTDGIVQDLSRISYAGFVSHMRRVNTPMDRSIKMASPHRLNTSQWGMMCPVESPDGASIGLLKNIAMLCHITFDMDDAMMHECFKELETYLDIRVTLVKDAHPTQVYGATKVLINYNWIAITDQAQDLIEVLRMCRRNNLLPPMVSLSWDVLQNEIHIFTDYGRCARPLLLVNPDTQHLYLEERMQQGERFQSWNDYKVSPLLDPKHRTHERSRTYAGIKKALIEGRKDKIKNATPAALRKLLASHTSVIEFIDVQETNTSLIAMAPTDLPLSASSRQEQHHANAFTHCEIHPSTIFSFYTSTIPFANYNQAPRNIFSGAQGKQAIGLYANSFNNRIDTMSYVLHYPQRPLVYTKYREYMDYNKLPNGENLIVAIATYTGYNQEDAVIINRASIERGCFNLTYYKAHVEEESYDPKTGESIVFANPEKEGATIKQYADFGKIDERGFPMLNGYMDAASKTVLLGKVLTKTSMDLDNTKDQGKLLAVKKTIESKQDKSVTASKTLYGFVDKVVLYPSPTAEGKERGLLRCKMRIRKVRQPELGDKMASSHGQKGVVGAILRAEDMPRTKEGLVPDLIVNPHAFPSRMTIGHLIECLMAKSASLDGFLADATAFEPHDVDAVRKQLEARGYEYNGNELMYDGFTGTQIPTDIFIGPTYYFRLKHMVADKINDRAQGPITSMTRQPTKGRGRDGGLRIGEMEENVLVAYGMSSFVKETFMERSDAYAVQVDREQGHITYDNKKADRQESEVGATYVAQVPFAFKQLVHELGAMNLNLALVPQQDLESDDDLVEMDDDAYENGSVGSDGSDAEDGPGIQPTDTAFDNLNLGFRV